MNTYEEVFMKCFIAVLAVLLLFTACTVEDDGSGLDTENGNDSSVGSNDELENDDGSSDSSTVNDSSQTNDNLTGTDDEQGNDDSGNDSLEGVTDLKASYGVDILSLSWTNPSMQGLEKIVVVRNMTQYPADMNDGDTVFEELGEAYSESQVLTGASYFYGVFACYGEKGCSKGAYVIAKPCFAQMDIAFVMDVSTTMGYMLTALENEIGLVWDFTAEKFAGTPRFGLTVFVDDVTVTNDGNAFASKEAITAEFNKWGKFTSTNKQTQSTEGNGDWPENSLDALALTAKNYKWRTASDTLKIIILATDDTFYENPKSFTSGIQVQHTYDQTVALLVDGKIRVGAFAAKKGGPTGNADVQPGFFTQYNGRDSIPYATGGEVYFIDDVQTGTLHIYETVKSFIESAACKSYDEK